MTTRDPTITRHEGDDHPTYTLDLHGPARASYEVAHDIIVEHVDLLNRVAELEAFVQRFIDEAGIWPDNPKAIADLADEASDLLADVR